MNVTVKLNDGLTIYPSFEPQYGNQLVDFYKNLYHTFQIEAYKIVNNSGFVVAQEGTL